MSFEVVRRIGLTLLSLARVGRDEPRTLFQRISQKTVCHIPQKHPWADRWFLVERNGRGRWSRASDCQAGCDGLVGPDPAIGAGPRFKDENNSDRRLRPARTGDEPAGRKSLLRRIMCQRGLQLLQGFLDPCRYRCLVPPAHEASFPFPQLLPPWFRHF